jgi:hypothetical protein
MRYACKRDLHDRCPGKWCECPCHQEGPMDESTDQEPKITEHPPADRDNRQEA